MRTTITVPDSLFQEIWNFTGKESPSKTITDVFKEYLRMRKINKLLSMAGKVQLDITREGLRALRDSR